MKATGMEDNSEAKPLRKSRGTLTVKWAGSRDKIFSPSGRGRTFFLTSLFIELIDWDCKTERPPNLASERNVAVIKRKELRSLGRSVSSPLDSHSFAKSAKGWGTRPSSTRLVFATRPPDFCISNSLSCGTQGSAVQSSEKRR